ncbi:hypothetical protein [Alkalihalobacterium chitinilyticum]|uniref:Uncharacterized protein n=1 Tax=Alkalihalobacterium chitinilyticum TaxID=2980103 RepID=A0ABT5VFD1_9BACI|nr:hypothetical protein [Alkalihalobacterium chitinilyticum]MDE5413985.1 hypothetical protein [Alkalihalobacterium chitinilyticum]
MKIFVKDDDGIIYEAFQMNDNTYTFSTENKTFKLSLSESKQGKLSEEQKKRMTKSIFSNEEVLAQLRDARKNRDSDFSYYSGDEKEFDKLVDEVNNDS